MKILIHERREKKTWFQKIWPPNIPVIKYHLIVVPKILLGPVIINLQQWTSSSCPATMTARF